MLPRIDPLRVLASLGVAASPGISAGCTEYLERRETIAAHAGNAVAANRAIHTIDPWPAAAGRTEIEVSGRRIVDAIERYEAGKPPTNAPATSTLMAVPMAMPSTTPTTQ